MSGKKVDTNHAQIRKTVQSAGAIWFDLTQAERNPLHCDALVAWRGRLILVEVKAPGKADDLTPDEREFAQKVELAGVHVVILENMDDVCTLLEQPI